MARAADPTDNASWPFALELFERGDPAFVDEIRRITDGERLGSFAARWIADTRPESRKLLFEYLDRPLNAWRHDALVKRLFKLAERAGDDEIMAQFLVAFDRCVRRTMARHYRFRSLAVHSDAEAREVARKWRELGASVYAVVGGRWTPVEGAFGIERLAVTWSAERSVVRRQTMGRPGKKAMTKPAPLPENLRKHFESLRLFTTATRRYLRRRAWRYFRKLGQADPQRYLRAIAAAIPRYVDADVADGLALLDNWGLVHVLFHAAPILRARASGWELRPGRSLGELEPAPYLAEAWNSSPTILLDVVKTALSRPVRMWAFGMLDRYHANLLDQLTPEALLDLLRHPDREIVERAVALLRRMPDLTALGIEGLLGLMESVGNHALDAVCSLLGEKVPAAQVALSAAARFAVRRSLPVARLGFAWLRAKPIDSAADYESLLALTEAKAAPLRPEMVEWLRGVLGSAAWFQPTWVLEFLDSRHADVRAVGWRWFLDDPRTRDDWPLWLRALETPYPDLRLWLTAELERRRRVGDQFASRIHGDAGLDSELLRFLWASVLLDVRRGGRCKPGVVGQVVERLLKRPEEAASLLPIVAAALRSHRGPEWRTGLAGIVRLVDRQPDLSSVVAAHFPELKLSPQSVSALPAAHSPA